MANSFFNRSEGKIPQTPDSNIVRVDMDVMEIGGRKSNLPPMIKSSVGNVRNTPNRG